MKIISPLYQKMRSLVRGASFTSDDLIFSDRSQRGSALFYIFLAIGLLAALTFTYVQDSRQTSNTQTVYQISENIYGQANIIRAAVMECVIAYPEGGGDLDGDTDIDNDDNANRPYPIDPSDATNPDGAAADDQARHMQCPGAPAGKRIIFEGAGTIGRFLPPPPSGFGQWLYTNDADGVYITIIGNNTSNALQVVSRLSSKYDTCEAQVNKDACGASCLSIYLRRASCP